MLLGLTGWGHVEIREATLRWGEGRLKLGKSHVDFGRGQAYLGFTIENVMLNDFFSLIPGGTVNGSGALAGHLPIRLSWGVLWHLALDKGFLRAIPPGSVQVLETEWLENALDSSSMAEDRHFPDIKTRILSAISDFAYDRLELRFQPESKGNRSTFFLSGKGRHGKDPQEIGGLTVNVNSDGLAGLIQLGIIRLQSELDENLDRQLEDIFSGE